MSLAAAVSTTVFSRANRNPFLARAIAFFQPTEPPATVDIRTELGLALRRVEALAASAPTWHPLHLERVLDRTVAGPLRSLQRQVVPAAADRIETALQELTGDGRAQCLHEAAIQLRAALRATGHA